MRGSTPVRCATLKAEGASKLIKESFEERLFNMLDYPLKKVAARHEL